MDSWLTRLEFSFCGAMLVLMITGLGAAVIMPGIDRWSKRFFTVFFSLLVVSMMICLADCLLYGNPDMIAAEMVVYYCESLLPSIIMPMLTAYLLHCCGEPWKKSPLFLAVLALWTCSFLLLPVSYCSALFFFVTPDNLFIRGPLYALLMMPLALILLLTLVGLVRRRSKLSKRYFYAFLICLLPLTASVLLHLFISVYFLIYVGISLSALSMYGIILSEQLSEYLRQQREIAHQRASIMVLQMRPHFIYNTMTSIYCLCNQDPQKARQVTMDFTTYLRKNFTAIASEAPIPFPEELEHTRAYLAVEQVQFEDMLFVDYDTPHTQFFLPPLTLQPIVENAVKHGLDPDSEPLRITIRTRETDAGSELTVEDNGLGFAAPEDNQPHIALTNIRQRLEMMCGGKLVVAPRVGGSVVKIFIPRPKT